MTYFCYLTVLVERLTPPGPTLGAIGFEIVRSVLKFEICLLGKIGQIKTKSSERVATRFGRARLAHCVWR